MVLNYWYLPLVPPSISPAACSRCVPSFDPMSMHPPCEPPTYLKITKRVSWSRVNWKIFSSMDRKVYTNFVRGKFQSVKSMIFLLMKLYSLFLFDTKKCIIDVDVVLIRASKKKEKRRKRKAINLLVERWTSFQSTSFQVLQNEEGKGWEPLLVAMASINRLTG